MSLDISPNVLPTQERRTMPFSLWRFLFGESRQLRYLRFRLKSSESRIASLEQQNQDLSDAAESMRRCLEMVTQQNIHAATAMGFRRPEPHK